MAIKVTKTKGEGKIDAGEYKAVIKGVEPNSHEKFGKNFLWKFKIKNPMRDGEEVDSDNEVTLSRFTTTKLTSHPKNMLNKLLTAVGFDLEEDDSLDLEDCIGKGLRVFVVDDEKDDATYSKISDFLKLKKSGTKETSSKSDEKEEKKEEKKEEPKEEKSSDDDFEFDFD